MRSLFMSAAKCLAASLMTVALIAATLMPASTTAEAGILRRYVVGRALVSAEKRWARHALEREAARRIERRAARNMAAEMFGASPKNLGFKPLSDKRLGIIEKKIGARTATREEFKRAYSQERFNERRELGVSDFWKAEKQRLEKGLQASRKWSEEQAERILNRKRPQFNGEPMEGHHLNSAKAYPQLADNPNNIFPATKAEHRAKWHGGSTRVPTHGTPRNPSFPDEF